MLGRMLGDIAEFFLVAAAIYWFVTWVKSWGAEERHQRWLATWQAQLREIDELIGQHEMVQDPAVRQKVKDHAVVYLSEKKCKPSVAAAVALDWVQREPQRLAAIAKYFEKTEPGRM